MIEFTCPSESYSHNCLAQAQNVKEKNRLLEKPGHDNLSPMSGIDKVGSKTWPLFYLQKKMSEQHQPY